MSDPLQIESTVNHLFRHQSGKMVAVLTRIFGTHNLELAEDVVQETLISALEQWKIKGLPQNPESWLFIVAKNKALNLIKKQRNQVLFGDDETNLLLNSGYTVETTFNQLANDELIKDDQLRMMFACCHPQISEENQITLILKTLCGFSTAEIAKAFLTSEDTISKRLYRTKEFYRENKIQLVIPNVEEISSRTGAVLNAIYLLFNEGYNSTHSEDLIRKDLLEEAVIICKLLTENSHTQLPEVNALMALMCFHASRSDSRLSREGEIILLSEQDRTKWNQALIEEGSNYFNLAASGEAISSYHLEAAIAFEHCTASSFETTNWKLILNYYNLLCEIAPSPITELNKAVATLQAHGPEKALQELNSIKEKNKLASYYLYYSLLGEICSKQNKLKEAKEHFEKALALTRSEPEKRMLLNKIKDLDRK
ncbi:MAG: sigma-70 family RNA polymerase sigma factor [Bacteroidetes bacterium]|nr:sigma-70 family RNA polymerase sigma factor [Bacteroidota bacterium]